MRVEYMNKNNQSGGEGIDINEYFETDLHWYNDMPYDIYVNPDPIQAYIKKAPLKIVIGEDGIDTNINLNRVFTAMKNIENFDITLKGNTYITSLQEAFRDCYALKSVPIFNLEKISDLFMAFSRLSQFERNYFYRNCRII